MRIPSSLVRSVESIESSLNREIEALVVPSRDFKMLEHITSKPTNKKIKQTFHISDRPLVTIGVADCNSAVIFGQRYFSLSHEYSQTNPKAYLSRVIDAMQKLEKNLSAIQIAGDEENFMEIGRILDRHGISVVKSYRDNFNRNKTFDLKSGTGQKDIFVLPDERRVVLYKRYYKLSCGEMVELCKKTVLYKG